jgi:glyoxylase-like metal-dependent hydrolase (beta-lactamase superfamily II)
MVGEPHGTWVLVDAGMRGTGWWLKEMASACFGRGNSPQAIVLTHGHFDHVGALEELADEWAVPVYAHRLEEPYLTGKSSYPPPDPTAGGFMAQLSRMFPASGIDISKRLQLLPADGVVPPLPEWKWIHTPGHTPGHVSLFREGDRTLLAGDAVITVNQDNVLDLLTQERILHGPPVYFTPDWRPCRESIRKLADLEPRVVGAGHGLPMSGEDLAGHLREFASAFQPPKRGRYVAQPAEADETGVTYVPPAPTDQLPKLAAAFGVGVALAVLMHWISPGGGRA